MDKLLSKVLTIQYTVLNRCEKTIYARHPYYAQSKID